MEVKAGLVNPRARRKHDAALVKDHQPEFACWRNIIDRCLNPDCSSFKWYGARGITVCERWMASFSTFLADVGPRPTPAHSLDRIDNDGHYEPTNCRWATAEQQNANRRQRPAKIKPPKVLKRRGPAPTFGPKQIREAVRMFQRAKRRGEKLSAAEVGRHFNVTGQLVRDKVYAHVGEKLWEPKVKK